MSFKEVKSKMDKIEKFYDDLMDDESRIVFDARFDYYQHKDKERVYNILQSLNLKYENREFRQYYDSFDDNKKIWIFGAGLDGTKILNTLHSMNLTVEGFVDNNRNRLHTKFMDHLIIDIDELANEHMDDIVIIGSKKYDFAMYDQLSCYHFPRKQIYLPTPNMDVAFTGNQYFDLKDLKKEENEVFVDCGCFDGMTSYEFAKWCDYNYKEIIAFEPDKLCIERCNKNFNKYDINNVELVNKATYSEEKTLTFSAAGMANSKIDRNGTIHIDATSIDAQLKGRRATFIKMDVEGSELDTLKGAKETIQKYKPKLAICVYHKPEDIVEIPLYLMKLDMGYKFYLRHYTSCLYETVLYAI